MGLLDGLGKFLQESKGAGTFAERLGDVGSAFQGNSAPTMEAQKTQRLSQQQVQQSQMLDELAQRIGLSPRERLLMRVSPDKAAEVLAKKLEPYSLTEGMGRYVPGEEDQTQFQPRTIESGDQFFQTQQGGGLNPVLTRAPSFAEQTARQAAEAKANEPVSVANGGTLVDPRTGKPIFSSPKTFAPQRPKAASGLEQMTNDQLMALARSLK